MKDSQESSSVAELRLGVDWLAWWRLNCGSLSSLSVLVFLCFTAVAGRAGEFERETSGESVDCLGGWEWEPSRRCVSNCALSTALFTFLVYDPSDSVVVDNEALDAI